MLANLIFQIWTGVEDHFVAWLIVPAIIAAAVLARRFLTAKSGPWAGHYRADFDLSGFSHREEIEVTQRGAFISGRSTVQRQRPGGEAERREYRIRGRIVQGVLVGNFRAVSSELIERGAFVLRLTDRPGHRIGVYLGLTGDGTGEFAMANPYSWTRI